MVRAYAPAAIRACAPAAAFLISTSALAQILPPLLPTSGLRTWTNNGGNGDWGTAGNWSGGGIPHNDQNTHAFFENYWDGTRAFVTNGSERNIGSLWFNAGTFYTLSGNGQIKLKGSGNQLIVVRANVSGPQSEHNINNRINVSDHGVNSPGGFIENYSEGGLRLGGDYFILGDRGIRIRGTGAIHLASNISGTQSLGSNSNGNIRVNEGDQNETPAATGSQPHFILSGYQPDWGGGLRVFERGFVIVKRDQALGRGSERHVYVGATLATRSHLETKLTYVRHQQNNYIEPEGLGIRRTPTSRQIGAIYNDGGYADFGMRIHLKARNEHRIVGLGSRGDREGGLELRNYVGGAAAFLKLGPGLIYLNNDSDNANQWEFNTTLRAGVLRIGNAKSLAEKNLIFDGGKPESGKHGGILELGGYGNFTRSLGRGNNQVRWTGDGGFSAFGAARSVNIGGSGATLTWGGVHFVGHDYALLLSSRYADNVITFANAINLGGAGRQREVRVERGGLGAYAVISGALSGTGGGLHKTGDGLLHLTGSNTYTGATQIEAGALRGAVGNSSSNIVLAGGVLGLDADFSRGLGGSDDQIKWDGSGGFAAYGDADRSVKMVDDDTTLIWGGTGGFIGAAAELRFGHHTANRTVLWEDALNLGAGPRTIRVERGSDASLADVEFRKAISGRGSSLYFVGNGRVDLTADNSSLLGALASIYGVELRLHGNGKMNYIRGLEIRYGGTLNLVNTNGSDNNRIVGGGSLTLAAGTLQLNSGSTAISQKAGDLNLEAGANAIGLSHGSASVELYANKLEHASVSRSTLDVSGDLNSSLISFKLSNSASGHELKTGTGDGIIPWAVNGDNWLIGETNNSEHFLKPLVTYFVNQQSSWASSHNVRTSSSVSLGGNRTINSLVLGGALNLGGNTLTINSGGLLVTGSRTINGSGSIATASNRPLYIHSSGSLSLAGSASIRGGMDVVKTRGGSLILNNPQQHQIGDLYIHQGTVELRNGTLRVKDRIYIGDGAGTDRLILRDGVWNQLVRGIGAPSITLRGSPYDLRGPEYGGAQAILQLGGNGPTYGAGTKQVLANLHIDGRGTIDWRGGEVGFANILWIDTLTFSSTSDQLFIRNWYEYEDLFLVKKSNFDTALLPQIIFEGYQDYVTTWKHYDNGYIQITPFGQGGYIPEPSTYGAILGAVGLGLVIWRKQRRRKSQQKN